MINCSKCGMMKMTLKSKCWCTAKKFNADKLSKQTRKESKAKPIAKVSEKRKALNQSRWRFDTMFKLIAKRKCDSKWNAVCEYCKTPFNLQFDFINQTVAFAHILSRWDVSYVHLAMFMNNIAFVCSEKCHTDMDAEICVLWIKKELQKRIEQLEIIDVSDLQKYVK